MTMIALSHDGSDAATAPKGADKCPLQFAPIANRKTHRDRQCIIAPSAMSVVQSNKPVPACRSGIQRTAGRCLALAIILVMLTGCGMQAKIIQSRHWELNDTIRQTKNEQLLLNMVRMRYDETPYFLQLSSITTSFSTGANAAAQATLPEEGPDIYGLSAGINYSESPTVTWSIPDSREFLARFYAPIGTNQLTVLTQSGFDLVDVFRVGSRKINLLRNKEFDMETGEFVPGNFNELLEALELIEKLRRDGVVDMAYGLMSNYGGVTVPISQIDTRGVAEGMPYSLLYLSRSPGMATPYSVSKPVFLRFSKESDDDPRAQRLRTLLKLRPDLYSFPITDVADVSPEAIRAVDGKLAQIFDPDEKVSHIGLTNRSVIEILRMAANYIEVPAPDVESGLARNRSLADSRFLTVLSSPTEPSSAWLKVRYQGTWFYIPATDLDSRESFTLLNAFFSSVVGEVPGAKPLLTLPVK